MARGFGAPESVPAGNAEVNTSNDVMSGLTPAGDGRADMHDVAESLDVHQGNNLHAFRKAYATQIVTRQIDEHDVFAAFLRIRQQILGELLVFLNGGATWSGTRDREGHGMTVIHFDQCFRAGTDDIEITSLRVSQRHEIHVRTGVQRTQHTVDVERIGRRINVETLGNNHRNTSPSIICCLAISIERS